MMSTKPHSNSPVHIKLEKQPTCPLCLGHCTNQVKLSCQHSFCQACIQNIPLEKKNESYYPSCPTCRNHSDNYSGCKGAFPVTLYDTKKASDHKQVTCDNCATAKAIGYCRDCSKYFCPDCDGVHKKWGPTTKHQLMAFDKVATGPVSPPTIIKQEPTHTCSSPIHDESSLNYYCDTCNESICQDCATLAHKDHRIHVTADDYTKDYKDLENSLNTLKGKIEAIKNFLAAITKRECEIRERGKEVSIDIHETVEEILTVLLESKAKLIEQARNVTNAKLKVLGEQAKSAKMTLSLLSDVEDHVEKCLKTNTREQVVGSKNEMMECMNEVTMPINVEEFQLREKADVVFSKDIKALHHIGDIVCTTALQQCRVKIDHFKCCSKGSKVSFSLSMEAPDLSLVSVPPSYLKCNLIPVDKGDQPIHTTVTTTSTHPGVYRIHCNPSTSGTHTVKVQLYDVQLEDTPILIPINPYFGQITQVRTITEVDHPWGVAVGNNGRLVVAENRSQCVKVLGRKVKSFGRNLGKGNVKFSAPRNIAITSDNFVILSDNHRILKLSMAGDLIASVGEEGSEQLQFNFPAGIAISPLTGLIYVADWFNHRVQVLNPDLTFSRSFASKGSAGGQLKYPCDIAIDNQGIIYVADNNCIQKFSPDGKFMSHFGGKESGLGQVDNPYGITIDNAVTGLVYVSEWGNHRISIFTRDGMFVRSFGEKGSNDGQFIRPIGITFDNEGFFYVCDFDNNRIAVY